MAQKKGSEILRDILLHYGVEYVYGIPGATEIWFMDVLEKTPEIQYILGLNEITCVGMAEGYARTKGRPAVLNLHTGPGMAAAMPMLVNCKNGHVPLVVTVGQNDSRFLQNDPQLSGDIVGMGKTIAKYATEIHHVEDLPTVLHRAFKMAMQPPMGPVVVSIPGNLLAETMDYEPRDNQWPDTRSRGDRAAVEKAAQLIRQAKNPVMLVQEGVAISGAEAETVRLAELMGARVYQVWMGDVNFPVQHPLYCGDFDSTGPMAADILGRADLLVGVGCQLFNDAFYSGRRVVSPQLKIVHISDDPWEVGKNFATDAGIVGDPKTVCAELCALLEGDAALAAAAQARTAAIQAETDAKKAALAQKIAAEAGHEPIAVSHLMNTIKSVIPEDTLILDDCWSSSGLLRSILDLKQPGSLCRPRNGGSIGFGPAGALGMKQAAPDRPVLAVCGDGSTAWGMQAFWTAAHYKIPVTYIITNNAVYRQVKCVRKIFMGDYPLNEKHLGMELDDPVIDFVQLAQSMGVAGRKVRKPEELAQAIREGMASGVPNLIEVYMENAPV